MQLHDWLILTSITCLIVATIYMVYILRNIQQKFNEQTIQIIKTKESLKTIPKQVTLEVSSTFHDVKQKIQMGWRIFSFLRRRRKNRKFKKQVNR